MAYRGDDAADALSAPTAEGPLEVVLGPNRLELGVADRRLLIAEKLATLVELKNQKQARRASLRIDGRLVVARGFPREDLGIWLECGDDDKGTVAPPGAAKRGMQRLFGIEPVSLLDRDGLGALKKLDTVAHRIRAALAPYAGDIGRAVEIGAGHALDKILLADHGDRYVVYARRLFRDRARFALEIHTDGKIVFPDGKALREVTVTSRFGVTVRGDYVRFADRHGTDLGRVSIPWIGPEDRDELARRIGQLVDR